MVASHTDDDDSVIDGDDGVPRGTDELNQPIPDNRPADLRRTQLLYNLQETQGF